MTLNRPGEGLLREATEKIHLIVFYSPDMDFCVSLRLLLQDQYKMATITDPKMLLMTVREFKPDLVIVDGMMTEMMMRRIEIMKQENPRIHIVSFYASRFDDNGHHQRFHQLVDAAFSKPIDLAEVTRSIHEMVARNI